MCSHRRVRLFGEITQEEMKLSRYGLIVKDEWLGTASIRAEVRLDAFVVMPNHLHAIVLFDIRRGRSADAGVGAHGHAPLPLRRAPGTLGSLIAGYKSSVTKRVNELRGTPRAQVWQRNYYERVIRTESELQRAQDYIVGNPARWAEDPENPDNSRANA